MKLIPYSPSSEVNLDIYYLFREENLKLCKIIEEEYGLDGLFLYTNNLNQIRKLKNIKNKTVLDLACGSIHESDYAVYEPWLARGLIELGTKVIGVDFVLFFFTVDIFNNLYAPQ